MEKYIIKADATIKDALKRLNALSGKYPMTLFVTDDAGKVLGTLTDGDIRRSLVAGAELSASVAEVMHTDFVALHEGCIDVGEIKRMRARKVTLVPRLAEDGTILRLHDFSRQNSLLPLDAVLMAGGKGERLRPLTDNTPKPLLTLGGKSIIDYNIEALAQNGISRISVTTNYLAEQIEEHFSNPVEGVGVKCVKEPCRLGTIGSLSLIDDIENENVLLMNSDLFTNISYEDMYLSHVESEADVTVAVTPHVVSVPFGVLVSDENGNVKGLEEKPVYSYYINAGIYIIKRELLTLIPRNRYYDATDFLEDVIAEGRVVRQFPINGIWIDIGSHADFRHAQDLLRLGYNHRS
ncbi:MAG: NTP transferase domain-containing protein [Muribaculaceae bacterium]|nr:NTP transferase domain-containing protein [Muribaculaceae bacterium]